MPKRSPTKKQNLTKVEPIEPVIRVIRRQRVILDSDLAEIYGVTTKRLNEQIKRNLERFPSDFMFRLTAVEGSSGTTGRKLRPVLRSTEILDISPTLSPNTAR